jgi:CheY-specific phosphatase CheX
MHVTVTAESIKNANVQVWEQMLAMRLDPIDLIDSIDPIDRAASIQIRGQAQVRCIGPEHVVGSCSLSGVWSGRIEVRLSRGLALQATSAMLMQPIASIHTNDTLDATREIANMIAGTIKSALPRPCSMTVPFAEVESGDFCILPRTPDSVTVFFHHAAGELMVRVWEQIAEAKSEASAQAH